MPGYYRAYAGAVLSAAINKYFYTVVSRRADDQVQIISSDFRLIETWENLDDLPEVSHPLALPIAVMRQAGKISGANFFLASEIPPGTGLGSSGSVCVNLVKATRLLQGLSADRGQLAETAYYIARERLRKPVGKQDEYAAAFGGLNFIRFERDDSVAVTPVDLPAPALRELQGSLLLFFTGVSHDSWKILKQQEQVSGDGLQALHDIRQLADAMYQALLQADFRRFGELLDLSWQRKRALSSQISTPDIDSYYAAARAAGAGGGKITGAGGGGYLLLYAQPSAQPAVRAALRAEGLREMPFAFDFHGTRVIANDPFLDSDRRSGLRWRLELAAG